MAVYFVRSSQGIKVGYTENFDARLRALQTANAAKLRVLVVIPRAGRDVEQAFHQIFAKWRLSGEWFSASSPILRTIDLIRQGAAPQFAAHLKAIADYVELPREQRMAARPPAIVPEALRGTDMEIVIRTLDALTRDPAAPQTIVGKAHAALRAALRGKQVDTGFLAEYKSNI